jgi:hypothetical protein
MSPRVREDTVHPRLQLGAYARPLNFAVRRHVLRSAVATLSNYHTLRYCSACCTANRTRLGYLGQLVHDDTPAICASSHRRHRVWSSLRYSHGIPKLFSLSSLRAAFLTRRLVDNASGWAQMCALRLEALW